jgi:hypothetical protein
MVRVTVVSNEAEVKTSVGVGQSAGMSRRLVALAAAALALLEGCAGVACTPNAVVVARKENRLRLRSEPRGLRTDAGGRLQDVRRPVIVAEHWVQDTQGRWHRVSEPVWLAAEPGRPIRLCP